MGITSYEAALLAEFKRRLAAENGPWSDHPISGEQQDIEFSAIRLDGDGGNKRLVVLFANRNRPQCTYGYRYRIYNDGDALIPASDFDVNTTVGMLADEIIEHVEAADLGLPLCDGEEIVWIAEDTR